MASSVAGHKRAFGSDTVPGLYEDFELADLVVLVGSNLAWCHPVLFQRLEAAKRARPHDEDRGDRSAPHRDLRHRRSASGAEAGQRRARCSTRLLAELERRGARRARLRRPAHDRPRRRRWSPRRPSDVVATATCRRPTSRPSSTGSPRTEKTVTLYSQGVNQSSAGVDKVNALINCHLLTGRIGRPGMGPFSITGQPNAMGGREVGALVQHARRAHGLRAGRRRSRRPLLARAAHGDAARPEGGRAVRGGRDAARSRRSGSWRPIRSPACPTPTPCATRSRAASSRSSPKRCAPATPSMPAASACRRSPGRRRTARSPTPSAASRASGRSCRAPGEARQDWWIMRQVAQRLGFGEAFAWNGVGRHLPRARRAVGLRERRHARFRHRRACR